MLKNVGMLCAGCGAGHHEDCTEVNEHEKDKHMCVCYWSVGPEYHQRMKREKDMSLAVPVMRVGVVTGNGKVELRTTPAPSVVGIRVQKDAQVSH